MQKHTGQAVARLSLFCMTICLLGCQKHAIINLPNTKDKDPGQYSLDQYEADLSRYETAISPDTPKLDIAQQARNSIAYGLMAQIEIVYGDYYKKLFGRKNASAITGDALTLGLGSAGSIATKVATKTILSALGTGVAGLNLSIDKNLYAQQSFQIIGIAMQTRRDKIRAVVINNLKQDVILYPLTAAKRDLITYLLAGTLPSGLQELQEEAGAATAQDHTPTSSTVPAAPLNLTANASAGQNSLLWEQSAGATSYNVYSSSTAGVTLTTGKKLDSVATNSYVDKNPTNPTFYVVTAVNTSGESPPSNEASVRNLPTAGMTKPTNLLAVAGDSSISLSWAAPVSAKSFILYRGTAAGVTKTTGTKIQVPIASGNSYTDSGLTDGTTYFYIVTAVNDAGQESDPSAETSATPIRIRMGRPILLPTAH